LEIILGYIGAVLIGLVLGLLGGGGSILGVPVLVYLFGLNPVTATAYSLFIVGTTSLLGAIRNMKDDLVDIKVAVVFAVPAFLAVYATRRYLIPAIPENLFEVGGFMVTKDTGIMVFFAIIMLLASISMIRTRKDKGGTGEIKLTNFPLIFVEGAIVGVLTGIVGAGGGFLIIPALVLLANLPMKKAVATSLFIIAAKSLIGFIGDLQNLSIDWTFLLIFSLLSFIGIFIGMSLNRKIDGKKLKKLFGWFVLGMSFVIMAKEIFLK